MDLTAGDVPLSEVRFGYLDAVYEGRIADDRFRLYLARDRRASVDPRNVWVQVLGGRLGVPAQLIEKLLPVGDGLVTGVSDSGGDASVPESVLEVARRGGLLSASVLAVPGARREQLAQITADMALSDGAVRIVLGFDLLGQPRRVVLQIYAEAVTLEYEPGRQVAFERRNLRLWLRRPVGAFMPGQLAGFVLENTRDGTRVAVQIPSAPVWPLPLWLLTLLRERV